jgi:hypothetical protein
MATDWQAELEKLEKAYASGALKVRFRDREVTYASGEDMLKRIKFIKRQIKGAASSVGFAAFSRGDG